MYNPNVDFSKLRVLVVENHELMRRLLRELLRGFDIQNTCFAHDVPGAIDHIYDEPFDLVILDFFLGELDGADFAKHIRFDEDCCNRLVPILLITGMPDHHKVMRVADAGINAILAKPIAAKDLYDRIHTLVSDPKPYIITNTYVGPQRGAAKTAPPKKRPNLEALSASARRRARRETSRPVLEDRILI